MAVIPGAKLLAVAQRGFEKDFDAILTTAQQQISELILQSVGEDGKIDKSRVSSLRKSCKAIMTRLYVDPETRRPYEKDGVTPKSPYAQVMNRWLVRVQGEVVMTHYNWLKKTLPEDVFAWLQSKSRRAETRTVHSRVIEADNPFLQQPGEPLDAYKARVASLRLFSPNPLAQYEPAHTWVDPNGYRLSTRIWKVAKSSRAALDQYLTDNIAAGTSALQMSRELEQFMYAKYRKAKYKYRTRTPYGTLVSYPGMRLARTEITRAHGQATMLAARQNPFVKKMGWYLSGSHPKIDVCDGYAENSPYELDAFPPYPAHPQCMCTSRPETAEHESVIQQLRGIMQTDQLTPIPDSDFFTPANPGAFLRSMLGEKLVQFYLVGLGLGSGVG